MKIDEKDDVFDRKSAQGSVYDKMYFTDDQLKQGAEINQKAAAGEISWDSAHNWWENTRSGYGYSGGEDGHGYTRLGSKTKETAPSYINQYQGAINQAANALMNREAFTYDPNTDPMYQQYRDSYTRQGQQAMQDTLAQNNYLAELAYQKERDKLADERYQTEWKYGVERDQLSDKRYDKEYSDNMDMAAAQLLGQAGDYSKYKELLGLTDEQVAALVKQFQEQNAPKVTGGGGGTLASAEDDTAGLFDTVPDEAITRIQSITNQDELAMYLDGLEQSGVISQDTADALYATYLPNDKLPDLSKRQWSVVDDGGTNWLWGVDNNAVVRDQYGNSYRLDALVDALVGHGMSSSDAKTYVKNLQKQLGI